MSQSKEQKDIIRIMNRPGFVGTREDAKKQLYQENQTWTQYKLTKH